jgi:hypothetical protein
MSPPTVPITAAAHYLTIRDELPNPVVLQFDQFVTYLFL